MMKSGGDEGGFLLNQWLQLEPSSRPSLHSLLLLRRRGIEPHQGPTADADSNPTSHGTVDTSLPTTKREVSCEIQVEKCEGRAGDNQPLPPHPLYALRASFPSGILAVFSRRRIEPRGGPFVSSFASRGSVGVAGGGWWVGGPRHPGLKRGGGVFGTIRWAQLNAGTKIEIGPETTFCPTVQTLRSLATAEGLHGKALAEAQPASPLPAFIDPWGKGGLPFFGFLPPSNRPPFSRHPSTPVRRWRLPQDALETPRPPLL